MSLERAFCNIVEKCNSDIHEIVDAFINAKNNDARLYIEIITNSRATFNFTNIISNEELIILQGEIFAAVHKNIKFFSLNDISIKSFDLENYKFSLNDLNELLREFILTGKIINMVDEVGSKCYETLLDNLFKFELMNAKKIGRDIWCRIAINSDDNTSKIEHMLKDIIKNIGIKLENHYSYQIAFYLYAKYDDIVSAEDYGTPLTA